MSARGFDVITRRLRNQRLAAARFATPEAAVAWFGAVQSQDYNGALWGLGQRCAGATESALHAAFDAGRIVRSHVLRPTWHFVAPADLRFMLALTAPRIRRAMSYYDRLLEIDGALQRRSATLMLRALRGRNYRTRAELATALRRGGIEATGQRLAHLVFNVELSGTVCSGPRRGKQFTYALVDERVPPVAPRTRDEALAELSRRYLASHGPATVRDYAWWSGLTRGEAQRGFAMLGKAAATERVGELIYWYDGVTGQRALPPAAHLLPNYDEYLIAYQDRGAAVPAAVRKLHNTFAHHLIIGGRVAGSWKRAVSNRTVVVDVAPYAAFAASERLLIRAAAARLGRFLEAPVEVRGLR